MKALLLPLSLSAPLAMGAALFSADHETSSCSSSSVSLASNPGGKTIVETAIADGNFKTLAAALTAAELVDALQGDGPFTVFAPTDAAFAKLPEGTVENLLKPENRSVLTSILTYHVVPGDLRAEKVVKAGTLSALNGQRIAIEVSDDGVSADGSHIVKTDIACENGVIHVIDSVMLPNTNDIVTTAVEAGSFKTLAAALEAGGLVGVLQGEGPFTVFAPTDEAFAKLPAGTLEMLLKPENKHKLVDILKYHVVSGRVYSDAAIGAGKAQTLQGDSIQARIVEGRLRINESNVLTNDLDTSNGVIHVIDTVLLP